MPTQLAGHSPSLLLREFADPERKPKPWPETAADTAGDSWMQR